jgi:AGZA family xanthine/uracil permease-like MFS transporter
MKERLDRFFGIHALGSSIPVEILAGASTFLSLSYIFVVNPAILAEGGMNKSAVLFATITTSALATIAMALWARLPFAVAPGMEMNSYVAFFVIGSLGLSWQQAMGTVFWSGMIFVVLTASGIRQRIIEAIPQRMKAGLAFCVGAFLALIGLKLSGILVYQGIALRGLGPILTSPVLALAFGLGLALILERLRIRGAVLLSIVVTSFFCYFIGLGAPTSPANATSSSGWFSAIGRFDLSVIANPKSFSAIIILFVLDFYGSVAKFIGLTENTPIMVNGKVPRIERALFVDGGATIVGASLGTSSLIAYVESAVGIGVGGRTGLTALICGVLMISCYVAAPLIAYVPIHATTGVLILIGIKLCPPFRELANYSHLDRIILALMLITVAFTFAIDRAMLIGFVGYLAAALVRGQKPNPFLILSTLLLFLGMALQILT